MHVIPSATNPVSIRVFFQPVRPALITVNLSGWAKRFPESSRSQDIDGVDSYRTAP